MRYTNRMIAWVMSVMMAVSAIPQGIGNVLVETEPSQEEATSETVELSSMEDTVPVFPAFSSMEAEESEEENADEGNEYDETEETTEEPTSEEQESNSAGDDVGTETNEVETTEPCTEPEVAEAVTENKGVDEKNTNPASTTETKETVTKETVEDEPTDLITEIRSASFDEAVSGVSTSGIDFTSKELMIGTEDPTILTWDTEVLSEYRGVYLTRYRTVEETRNAYTYYYGKADFVSANITFRVADEDGDQSSADLSNLNEGNDALANLNDLSTSGTAPSGTIALIDTGVSGSGLVGSVSVLGGSSSDDNGHGTRMLNFIREEYPNAKVLSIKAMGADGTGQASDVYAAIQYAIAKKVDIINLSISAYCTVENAVVQAAIEEAVSKGIKVVGSAGNNGGNARYYIPGSIGAAVIVGACDESGERIANSNYGSTVDYNVAAGSTSEAAARMSAIIAKNDGTSVASIFTTNYSNEDMTGGTVIFEDGTFVVDNDPSKGHSGDYDYVKRIARSGNTVVFRHYDKNGNAYTDDPEIKAYGYTTNTLCVRFSGSPGDNGYEFDVTKKEITEASTKQLIYNVANAVKNGTLDYGQGHRLLCYAFGQKKVSISGVDMVDMNTDVQGFTITGVDSLITTYLDSNHAIPANVEFHAYYLHQLCGSSASYGTYQDFVSWKLIEKKNSEFYISMVKSSADEYKPSMEGIQYTVYGTKGATGGNDAFFTFTLKASGEVASVTKSSDWPKTSRYQLGDVYEQSKRLYAHIIDSEGGDTIKTNTFYIQETKTNDNYLLNENWAYIPTISSGTANRKVICAEEADIAGEVKLMSADLEKVTKDQPVPYYYTTIVKGVSVGNASMDGCVYGLYTKSPASGGKLVAKFTMDKDGYCKAISKGDAFDDYTPASGWQTTLKFEGHDQHVLCLDTNPTGWIYKEISVPKTSTLKLNDKELKAGYTTAPNIEKGKNLAEVYGVENVTNGINNDSVFVYLQKISQDTDCTDGNVNYSLAGAEYLIYDAVGLEKLKKDSDGYPVIDETKALKDESGNTIRLITDNTGISNVVDVSSLMDIDKSTGEYEATEFCILEKTAPKHYERTRKEVGFVVDPTNIKGNEKKVSVSDIPVKDPINVQVVKESDSQIQLEGATFTLKFYPEDITKNYSFEQLQSRTATITETYTTKKLDNGEIRTQIRDRFPMGYITLEETVAPENYYLPKATDKAIVNGKETSVKMAFVLDSKSDGSGGYEPMGAFLVEDGKRSEQMADDITVENEFKFTDREIRGDVELDKADVVTGNPMEGIRFQLDQLDLDGNVTETHYLYTDENGHATTVTDSYSDDTLNYYNEDDHKDYDHTAATVWFGSSKVENGKHALPVGHYRITELPCGANEGMQLAKPFEFEIKDDGTIDHQIIIWHTDSDGHVYNVPKPEVRTVATAVLREEGDTEYDDAKMVPASKNQTIKDVVSYSFLKADTEYTLVGRIMEIKGNGEVIPFKQGEEEVVVTHTFRTKNAPEDAKTDLSATGEEEVFFENLDFTGQQDKRYVVYETLYLGTVTEGDGILKRYTDANPQDQDIFPIEHSKPDDVNQQVHTPNGGTDAEDVSGTKTVTYTDTVTLKDVVSYTGLEIGREYELHAVLYVRPEGELKSEYTDEELAAMMLKDKNGKPVTASKIFIAKEENGKEEVLFTFDVNLLTKEAETLVVFEDCEDRKTGISCFTHAKIDSNPQTVFKPEISTTAQDINGRHELAEDSELFRDVITYKNIAPQSTCRFVGIAMNKKTGEVLTLGGKEVTSTSETFVTGKANNKTGGVDGTFTLEFEITKEMQKDLAGVDMVIYETLYVQNKKTGEWREAARHHELDDEGQELIVPTLKTTLLDKVSKSHVAYPGETITLQDTCKVSNLVPLKEYRIEGYLMNKDTNKPMLDQNNKRITASRNFKASETGDAVVILEYTFNSVILKGQGTSVICFESCYPKDSDIPVCVHADITDESQEVDLPHAWTEVGKFKVIEDKVNRKVTITNIVDSLHYDHITKGYSYTVKGYLTHADGSILVVNGKEVRAEATFTAESTAGTINVFFPDLTFEMAEGETSASFKFVVFEELYVNVKNADGTVEQHIVSEHKDSRDSKQTLSAGIIVTGDETPLIIFLGLAVLAVVGIGIVLWKKRKLNKEA